MKLSFLLSFTFCAIICYPQATNFDTIYTPAEMVQDLGFLIENLEKVHPDLYTYTEKSEVDRLVQNAKEELSGPKTRIEFALKVIPIISALKDGHTRLLFPREERSQYLEDGGAIFPFYVRLVEGRVYIKENLSAENSIQINSEITSINGIPINEILMNMRNYKSAELDHFLDIQVERDFRRLLWYLYGFQENYAIGLDYNGEKYEKEVMGIGLAKFNEITALLGQANKAKPFSYYQLEGTSIGGIDFRVMSYKKEFKNFLDSTFTAIKQDNIQQLIIDIRQNGGGNSQLADMLFDYITEKPYKMVEQMDIKISKRAKQSIKKRHLKWYSYPLLYPAALFINQARPYFYGKNGTIKTIRQKKLDHPKKVKQKFMGETFLLTSAYTFSSANMLAIAYKCYQMGTVVGEETGGISKAYGELIEIRLPNTKLIAYCSSKRFVHPCNEEELRGVIPDIEIKSTIEDIRLERDAAIEHIKSIIEQKN